MKNYLRIIVTTLLLFLTTLSTTVADSIINKTYFNARTHGSNQALIHAAGTQDIINRKDYEKFGGFLQGIVWYARGDMQSQYWSPVDCKCNFTLGTAVASVDSTVDTFTAVEKADLDARLFILNTRTTSATETEIAQINFDPKQNAYGITLFYDQRLDQLFNGLFFNVTVPITYIENSLNTQFIGTKNADFEKYFYGKYSDSSTANAKQSALQYALMTDDPSNTCIADIDINLGYTFYEREKRRASYHVGITIPTGQQPTAKHLFSSTVGNGRHFGFGGGMQVSQRIWGDLSHNLFLHTKFDVRYLLEAHEQRVLGIKGVRYGHYHLLAQISGVDANGNPTHTKDAPAIPAANVLAQKIAVTPGAQFDGIVALDYNNDNFSASLGYNLFLRETETIALCDRNPLADKTYGLIKPNFLTNQECHRLTQLTEKDLDKTVAQTPSFATHKIFGSLAYTFKEWDIQYHLALGGHYEFAQGRRGLENWGINVRLGIGV